MAEVRFYNDDKELCNLDCYVADDMNSRYTGLSEYDELAYGEGMVFLYMQEGMKSFVMRDMSFDIDIIFADGDGEVTEVHSAESPEGNVPERSLEEYNGYAQAVVEVPYGFAEENNIIPGKTRLLLQMED